MNQNENNPNLFMDRRKRSRVEAHPPRNNITSDVVWFHILPWLPVKSVLRFKSISKQWHLFLSSSMFRKMHFNAHQVINTKKLVVISPYNSFKFHTIDCERPKDGFTAGLPLPFKVEPRQSIRILTSVHGLVCVGIYRFRLGPYIHHLVYYSALILWNPETGEHKTLSKPKPFHEHEDCYMTDESLFGLYHSSWDDDYKLLGVTRHPNVYIYSLKSDSWRKVDSDFQRIREHNLLYSWVSSDTLYDNLYFLEYHCKDSFSIMRFDTKNEMLKLIATPFLGRDHPRTKTTWLSFTVDQRDGCIHLWVNIGNSSSDFLSRNELWRMEAGDGDWTKVENSGKKMTECITDHERLHLMRNGNLLMYGGGCVYQQDMKTHTKQLCSYKHISGFPGGKYIETMVSPNQYTIK